MAESAKSSEVKGRPAAVLAMTSFDKGYEFLRTCQRLGTRTFLLTTESLRSAPWPREALADIYFMPDLYNRVNVINAVSYLARGRAYRSHCSAR